MSTIEEIEEAVTRLSRNKLAKFGAWFEEFEAAQFDRQIAPASCEAFHSAASVTS